MKSVRIKTIYRGFYRVNVEDFTDRIFGRSARSRRIQGYFATHVYGTKQFAFTRIMKCGKSGHGVTAMERTKQCKNGTSQRFAYYFCTSKGENPCRSKCISVKDLIQQMVN